MARNERSWPLSSSAVRKRGFDPATDNPLAHLHPHEVTAALLFVAASGDPRTAITMPSGKHGTWSVLQSGTFHTRFRETFGFELQPYQRKSLEQNAAWRTYVQQLRDQTRDSVMQLLEQQSLDAFQDYTWSRKAAREAGDYKETRVAAGDHLDRIGATKKPDTQAQQVVVVLRGRNFDEGSLDKELPAIEAEVVVPEPESV